MNLSASSKFQERLLFATADGVSVSCRSFSVAKIPNSFARTVVKFLRFSHITSVLKSPHWLKVKERIDYKLLSHTYKVLTTSQPIYLFKLVSVQSSCSTRSLCVRHVSINITYLLTYLPYPNFVRTILLKLPSY